MSNSDDVKEARQRLYAQIDRVENKVDNIDVTMARNTTLLEEHIRRTNILEDELKPIKEHVANVRGGLAWLKTIGLVSGSITALMGVAAAVKAYILH